MPTPAPPPNALPPSAATQDVAVVGLGPAGLACALALAGEGLTVALVGPVPGPDDLARETRTTALFGGSIDMLRHLGAWQRLHEGAAALTGLRLVDDTGSVLRAPETLFQAHEIGRDAFGYNVDNAALVAALLARVRQTPAITVFATLLENLTPGPDAVALTLRDGQYLRVGLVAGADGRRSACRQAAGVTTTAWTYPQTAIATRFSHARGHDGISTELHRRAGPLTTVPLPGRNSSLVWVENTDVADGLMGLDEDAFRAALAERLQGLLGDIGTLGPRAAFPLSGAQVRPMAARRIALIGEAAHVLPPIGAQGLNLGLRDAAWLAELAGAAQRDGRDIGAGDVLTAYDRARHGDVGLRVGAVDLVNRSLFADLLPADLARGAGLVALSAMPWLRRLVMRQGVEPGGRRPRLLAPA